MAIAFSSLSLKRDRSSSTPSTNKSTLNAIINKITSPFTDNDSQHKKRRQQHARSSSLSIFKDYFRGTTSTDTECPFANDALFEQNRYQQQKKQPVYSPPATNKSILVKKHRHTNSSPSALPKRQTPPLQKKSNHIRHYSHVSCISASNMTVKSEDLTAKEFADIAGIRILSENEDEVAVDHGSKVCTFCGDEDETDIMVPSLIQSAIRSSNNSSIILPELDEPHIWDNVFWKKPGHQLQQDTIIKRGRFEIHISPNDDWKRRSFKNGITA